MRNRVFAELMGRVAQDWFVLVVFGLISIASGVLFWKAGIQEHSVGFTTERIPKVVVHGKQVDLENTIAELQELLKKSIPPITATTGSTNVPEFIPRLESNVKELNLRLSKLETAIESSPEKALAIPLLRKDLEDQRVEIAAMRNEIARTYDFSKWFLALIGAWP